MIALGLMFYIDGFLLFKYRQWSSSMVETFSNYKKIRNLVEAIERHFREGKLKGCKGFLLTDNLVAKNIYFKGSSSSETLFNLVLNLRKLELEKGNISYGIRVAKNKLHQELILYLGEIIRNESCRGMTC